MNFLTNIEEFSKEVKVIDNKIKSLYEQADELSNKKNKINE